jgi:glucose-1-phosphate cytidylyltransferase
VKAVILAGGLGTRLAEETIVRPKPMVEIGGRPILWHIMKTYARHGITDFIICLGYKGYLIKEYFANYFLHQSDVTFDLSQNRVTVHQNQAEPWMVTLVDTGAETMTGGRIKRAAPYLGDDHEFCLTYGDGVADIDLRQLIRFHREQGRLATVTVTQPPGRFGRITMDQTRITRFEEKPGDGGWVSAGYFVLSRTVLEYIDGDMTAWEKGPLERLAQEGQISAYMHKGFWQCMDTVRDMQLLEGLWASGRAPWKVW